MILAIIPLACFAELFLVMGNLQTKTDWSRSFLRASIIWGSYAIVILELLSLASWISALSLSLAWLLPTLILGIALSQIYRRSHVINIPTFSLPSAWIDRILIFSIGAILLITLIVAWITPPQTPDSYVYHMSRVAHWAQNHSIGPYVTGIRFQNTMSPAAEFFILHFYVITASDKLANLVQWFAMLGSLSGVWLIASQMRVKPTGKLLAIAFAASLPMGIVQASSTMTDYVVTFWMICVISEGLELIQGGTRWMSAFFLGCSLGLAIAAKPTSFAFLLPFGILISIKFLQQVTIRKFLLTTLVILICISVINLGHNARNYILYGSPIGHEGTLQRHANEVINVKVILSNTIRHASLHVGTIWPDLNDWIYHQIVKIHVKLNQDINDPLTTFTEFRILTPNTSENTATNPFHAYLILIGFILAITFHSRLPPLTRFYGIAAVLSFIVFSAVFKYQIFGSRLQLPFFILIAPFMGAIYVEIDHGKWSSYFGIALILLSFPWLFQISSRPIIPNPEESQIGSIFFQSRENLYFPETRGDSSTYKTITDRIKDHDCNNIGLMLSGSSSEYLWWVLLDAPKKSLQIEWIISDSPTTRYEDPDFKPCAIICENCPSEWTKIRGLPLVEEVSDLTYRLFLDTEESR
jgi:hypothetical protein